MSKFKVLLADDHALFRAGLRSLMELENDIQVVGEAENGRLAVELTKTLRPEIVVMDIAMPILNGLEATRQILHEIPETKILILSGYSNNNYIDEVIDAGACGYLIKQSSPGAMLKAIREIRKGNKIYSPSISNHVRERYKVKTTDGKPVKIQGVNLTSRESEVLQLVAEGQANKNIADELGISIKTVEKHRQQLKRKLKINDTAGLTRYAIAAGVIEK
jgi:DNA-binding NarL/FixJ family response regulator